jgi:hypothetical protein
MKVGSNMKKLLSLVVVIIMATQVFALTGCGGYWADKGEHQPDDGCCGQYEDTQWSKLAVTIIKHPQGGVLKSQLTCTFQVTYTWQDQEYYDGTKYNYPAGTIPDEPPSYITLHTYWSNGQSKYNETKRTFDVDNPKGEFTLTLQPSQAGLYFDKTFEAGFGWSDGDGNHNIFSSKAVCTVP